jgi:hypothetical protein
MLIAAAAALLLLFVAGLAWKFASGPGPVEPAEELAKTDPPVAPPPPVEVRKTEPEVAPEPVKPEPVKPEPVKSDPDVEPLPKIAKAEPVKPEVVKNDPPLKFALPKKVTIEKASCEPTEGWRKSIVGGINEMGDSKRVNADSVLYALYEKEGRRVQNLAIGAKTVGECVAAQDAFNKLKSGLGF